MLRSILPPSRHQGSVACHVAKHGIAQVGFRYKSQYVGEIPLKKKKSHPPLAGTVQTFRPNRLMSAGQNVLDLSGKHGVPVHVKRPSEQGGYALSACLSYFQPVKGNIRFPSQTRGVLYFHEHPSNPTKSEMRFRLCESVDDFQQGTDLLLPNGSPWCIPFNRMQKLSSNHAAFLNLLHDEYSLTVDPDKSANRKVSTLTPEKLVAHNQRVFDFSGMTQAWVTLEHQSKFLELSYRVSGKSGRSKFPAHTKGVFYYIQSTTAPTQIGELRFRLCDNALSFDQGRDLCLPSGEIWHLDSNTIHSSEQKYTALKAFLITEGLLDSTLRTGYGASERVPHSYAFSSVSQIFTVDFKGYHRFAFDKTGTRHVQAIISFRDPANPSEPLYHGRAVAKFEPCDPQTTGKSGSTSTPFLVMRVLELLTPVTKLFDSDYVADSDYLGPIVAGELVTVKRRGHHVPWTLRSRTPSIIKAVQDFLKS